MIDVERVVMSNLSVKIKLNLIGLVEINQQICKSLEIKCFLIE